MKIQILSILAGLVASAGAAVNPYGACAHVTRGEAPDRTCEMLRAAGLGWVRSDFDWTTIETKQGEWNFATMDRVVSACEARGVQLLPILTSPPAWARPAHEKLDKWSEYVKRVVAHYQKRLPVLEVWNEENISAFWKSPNPTNYYTLLRRTYEAARSESCQMYAGPVSISFGGTAGVPLSFIEEVYKLGGARFFDIMSVHPYSHPRRPEGSLDIALEKLRALMAKYGDAKKPIWITELGWPTHQAKFATEGLVRAALRTANPEKKEWHALYLPSGTNDEDMAPAGLAAALPPGSTLETCYPEALKARLARGDVDVLFYPFTEAYPVDTFPLVLDFVKKGGLLVDFGGMPMWYGTRITAKGQSVKVDADTAAHRAQLRLAETAWWYDKRLPKEIVVRPTASVQDLMSGYSAKGERFFTDRLLKPGDKFIPLLSAKANDVEAVCAGVYKFNSDYKGAVAVSGVFQRSIFASDEARQAKMMARSLGISFAEGVQTFLWYEMTQPDSNPYDPESYFGILHANFAPKPAYTAYMTFIDRRPVGSVQLPNAWHDQDRLNYYPQWKLPDGRIGGMVWKVGKAEMRPLRFTTDKIEFVDLFGARVRPVRQGDAWLVPVSDSPIYFRGGALRF